VGSSKHQTTMPVSPKTVTVLGYRVKATDPAWLGLDLSRAILREQSTAGMFLLGPDAPPDHHLDVPWCHPNDQPGGWRDGLKYRVRPRRKAWRFVKEGDEWRLSTK
jgi:hypothetical protein